jgi:hypothetical protein
MSMLAVAPDGHTLAALGDDGSVDVWSLIPRPIPFELRWGLVLFLVVAGGWVLAWPRLARRSTRLTRLGSAVAALGVLVCAGLWIRQGMSGPYYRLAFLPHDGARRGGSLAFSADSRLLALSGAMKVKLWKRNGVDFTVMEPLAEHESPTSAVAFAGNGPWLYSLDESAGLLVTHVSSGEGVWRGEMSSAVDKAPMIVAPDGRHAIVSDFAGALKVVRFWTRDGLDKPLQEATKVLARDPKDRNALEQRTRVYLQRGQLRQALGDLDALVEQGSTKDSHWLRAMTHARLGNRTKALADLDCVIKASPLDALAHYQRGLLLMEGKDYRNARRSLDKAFKLEPRLADSTDEGK